MSESYKIGLRRARAPENWDSRSPTDQIQYLRERLENGNFELWVISEARRLGVIDDSFTLHP